eukprot:6198541-Pleurochrysis_carterae.AAC.3
MPRLGHTSRSPASARSPTPAISRARECQLTLAGLSRPRLSASRRAGCVFSVDTRCALRLPEAVATKTKMSVSSVVGLFLRF